VTDRPTTGASDVVPVRRALLSCWDKQGLEGFATALAQRGVALVSTGSTAATLRAAGLEVTEVAEVTGFPECLDGRVKTLHPHVHAGILADRRLATHVEELERLGIAAFDLVVVNLYPFAGTVASGAPRDEVVEMIDIGGPTMVRAAAKNHACVAVVTDPADHARVLADLEAHGGTTSSLRRDLAAAAFRHTATYDAAVATWFTADVDAGESGERSADTTGDGLAVPPRWMGLALERSVLLRYGENPHQAAALYVPTGGADGVASARVLGGKALSYNNLLDADAAWGMVVDVGTPAVAIIKHTNPSGFATDPDLTNAYERALAADPVSAFGGIVAANRPIDAATAARIVTVFTEVVIAPGYDDEALALLTARPNLRVLAMGEAERPATDWQLRSIGGGVLVQAADTTAEPFDAWQVVSRAAPDDATLADLRFAWIAAKHTKSNAIVLVDGLAVVGVGAGQMSRVDSVRLAVERSGGRHRGAVQAGVRAVVQPGGSVRDEEVVAAADEHGLALVFTGRRHFRH
jgi:phosphoribosylaminoimidazolecarboxamide formyltransferase / IMP cyclohydrolase